MSCPQTECHSVWESLQNLRALTRRLDATEEEVMVLNHSLNAAEAAGAAQGTAHAAAAQQQVPPSWNLILPQVVLGRACSSMLPVLPTRLSAVQRLLARTDSILA